MKRNIYRFFLLQIVFAGAPQLKIVSRNYFYPGATQEGVWVQTAGEY